MRILGDVGELKEQVKDLTPNYHMGLYYPTLEIAPHPSAPIFNHEDPQLIFKQLITDLSSGNPTTYGEMLEVFRQAGLVSLWFFLKFIAGYEGPFNLITDHLHMDMCNYRQGLLENGCRGAMFIPRGHYKTTVCTEGGGAWEIIRNPDIRIKITHAIAETAQGFLQTIKAVFDSNSFVARIYPEFVPQKGLRGWNETRITCPARTRKFREATVEYGGVGGASEGHHFDLHIIDDMIGLNALNAMHQSSAEMLNTRNWFWGSEKTLLVSMRESRVIVIGTRYAVDDVYDEILRKAGKFSGYPMDGFGVSKKGRWKVYYRKAVENDEIIFPENFTKDAYDEMARDDWWTWVTQYLNDPRSAGLTEFETTALRKCFIEKDDRTGSRFVMVGEKGQEKRVYFDDLDIVIAVDPAATEKYISAKTSKSAIGVVGRDCMDNFYLLDLFAGYISPTELFDKIFQFGEKYKFFSRGVFLESNGGFKTLAPLLREEEKRRGFYLKLHPFTSIGEKDARIRSTLEPVISTKRFYVAEGFYEAVMEEVRAFPQSVRKDIIDMITIGINSTRRPWSEEELIANKEHDMALRRKTNQAGY